MAHHVSDEVELELDEIWYYIAVESGRLDIADGVVDSVTDCFVMLGRNPRMGRRRDDDLGPGLRSFPVGNYVIVYCIEDEEDALMLHVFHGSQDIEFFFRH